jgi:hypothetical protein
MGSIPVEGPFTSAGIMAVENVHAYGAFGLEPDADAEPVWFSIDEEPPFGAEIARCFDQQCGNSELPEVIQVGTDYNLYEGWYFIRTTADSYWANGDVKDELMAWVYGEFCAVIDGCDEVIVDPPVAPEIIMM